MGRCELRILFQSLLQQLRRLKVAVAPQLDESVGFFIAVMRFQADEHRTNCPPFDSGTESSRHCDSGFARLGEAFSQGENCTKAHDMVLIADV